MPPATTARLDPSHGGRYTVKTNGEYQRRETFMTTVTMEYHPLYLEGIRLFNACEFFEAHDVWEELWSDYQGPSRKFYQGLIQAAVCLHHFGNGNVRGARKLFHSSSTYLEPYRPQHEGLDVDTFLTQMAACCAEIVASVEDFPEIELQVDLIPEIHLVDAG